MSENEQTTTSSCDLTEELFAEFEHRLPLPLIATAVGEVRRQLDASPNAAAPADLEPRARDRLAALWRATAEGAERRDQ